MLLPRKWSKLMADTWADYIRDARRDFAGYMDDNKDNITLDHVDGAIEDIAESIVVLFTEEYADALRFIRTSGIASGRDLLSQIHDAVRSNLYELYREQYEWRLDPEEAEE